MPPELIAGIVASIVAVGVITAVVFRATAP